MKLHLSQITLPISVSAENLYKDEDERVIDIAKIIASKELDFNVPEGTGVVPTSHDVYAAKLILEYLNAVQR